MNINGLQIMRSLSSPCHQHLSDVVFCFLHAAFKVDLLLLENKHDVTRWTPLRTMHTALCDLPPVLSLFHQLSSVRLSDDC